MDQADALSVFVAQLVRGLEPSTDLSDEVDGDGERDTAALVRLLQEKAQGLAGDELHHEVQDAVLFSELVRLGHVRVMDLRRQHGFAEQHPLRLGVLERTQNGLDRHQLLEAAGAFEARGPNSPHAAGSNRHEQLVATEHLPGSELSLVMIGCTRHAVPPCLGASYCLRSCVTGGPAGAMRGAGNCRVAR
jgi:hypothetical protein